MGPLSIEQALAEEVIALGGRRSDRGAEGLRERATKQGDERERIRKDADARSGQGESADEVERHKAFYRSLNKLDRTALCLSGGGIRSATFCLGVIQALAAYDVTTGTFRDDGKQPAKPQNSLLGRFHFLSTVSGGGYIGSWLSSWRRYDDFPRVWNELTSRPDGPDVEPPEISWLRAYSNYLTPRVGVGLRGLLGRCRHHPPQSAPELAGDHTRPLPGASVSQIRRRRVSRRRVWPG